MEYSPIFDYCCISERLLANYSIIVYCQNRLVKPSDELSEFVIEK